VRIDKDYRFATDEGTASLADLFRGRSQLLVYHFMFGPEYNRRHDPREAAAEAQAADHSSQLTLGFQA
jgi:predicted dithiol-disulfide oxidoreductase (DUF899 family)